MSIIFDNAVLRMEVIGRRDGLCITTLSVNCKGIDLVTVGHTTLDSC